MELIIQNLKNKGNKSHEKLNLLRYNKTIATQ